MQILIDLDLPGLENSLAELLPAGIRLEGLEARGTQLRANLHAPMVGSCTLTAGLQIAGSQAVLSHFDLEGAGLAKPFALSALKRKIAEVDQRKGGWRIWGDSEGDRLHLNWS
jgi:hypothetical protein